MESTREMKANEYQVAGSHYSDNTIQPWDYIVANGLGYLEGNIIKYTTRWRRKGGIEDLKKVIHYAEKLIEVEIIRKLKEEHDMIGEALVKPTPLDNDVAVMKILQLMGQISLNDLEYVLRVTAAVYRKVA